MAERRTPGAQDAAYDEAGEGLTIRVATAVVAYAIAACLCWALWRQVQTGRIGWMPWAFRCPTITRTGQPVRFWMTVAAQAILALVVAIFPVALTVAVFDPNPN